MSTCKITLYGFDKYMHDIGDDLFYNLSLPTSTYLDIDALKKNFILRGGEFEVVYSDPFFMKEAIGVWSKKWYRTIDKWCEALALEYNPIDNYDRYEEWTDKSSGIATDKGSAESETTSENTVSAYNSSTYENDNKNVTGSASSDSNTSTTDTQTVHNAHLRGNIGITTSQAMLREELDIAQWNLYEKIADVFLTEFCIPVY